jgi:hypothetical protein
MIVSVVTPIFDICAVILAVSPVVEAINATIIDVPIVIPRIVRPLLSFRSFNALKAKEKMSRDLIGSPLIENGGHFCKT